MRKHVIQIQESKKRLKEICKDLDMTYKDFAPTVGMSVGGFGAMMAAKEGAGRVSKTLALAIQAVHGINHKWILEGGKHEKYYNKIPDSETATRIVSLTKKLDVISGELKSMTNKTITTVLD